MKWPGNNFSKFRVLDERLLKAFINCSYETIGCIGTNKNGDFEMVVTKVVSECQLLETGSVRRPEQPVWLKGFTISSETSTLTNSMPEVVSRPIVDTP